MVGGFAAVYPMPSLLNPDVGPQREGCGSASHA
jgi:hypothetical protein